MNVTCTHIKTEGRDNPHLHGAQPVKVAAQYLAEVGGYVVVEGSDDIGLFQKYGNLVLCFETSIEYHRVTEKSFWRGDLRAIYSAQGNLLRVSTLWKKAAEARTRKALRRQCIHLAGRVHGAPEDAAAIHDLLMLQDWNVSLGEGPGVCPDLALEFEAAFRAAEKVVAGCHWEAIERDEYASDSALTTAQVVIYRREIPHLGSQYSITLSVNRLGHMLVIDTSWARMLIVARSRAYDMLNQWKEKYP